MAYSGPPVGTPATYTDSNGNIYPAVVNGNNGVYPEFTYFDSAVHTTSGIATRDDSGATPNSWGALSLVTKFEGT